MLPELSALADYANVANRWLLDEASGDRADSVGSVTLTDNGTVSTGTGPFGDTCADLVSSVPEYFSGGDNCDVDDFTWSVWINTDDQPATNQGKVIAAKMGTSDTNESYVIEYRDFSGTKYIRIWFENSSNQPTEFRVTKTLQTGKWYYLTISVDVSNPSCSVLLNCFPKTPSTISSSATSVRDSTATFGVGRRVDGGIFNWNGLLQDLIRWTTPLTAAQQCANYIAHFNLPAIADFPQSGSWTSRWMMTEDCDDRGDSIGSNHLTDNNAIASAAGISYPAADARWCADLELSSSQYLSIAHATQSGLAYTGDLSMSALLSFESLPSSGGTWTICSKWGSGNQAYRLNLHNDSGTMKLEFQNSSTGSNTATASVNWTPSTDTFYHVVASYDASAGSVDFYVDGTQVGSTQTGLYTSIFSGVGAFNIGAIASAAAFDGKIQDFAIGGFAITSSEASDLYALYAGAADQDTSSFLLMF